MPEYTIHVRWKDGTEGPLALTDDLTEALLAADWIVGAGSDRSGMPGAVAAWVTGDCTCATGVAQEGD